MIKEYLDKASKAYYLGHPIISDEEYDNLASMYKYNQIGMQTSRGIEHLYPMYSLQKVHPGEDAPKLKNPIESPKLDGAAIAIVYIDGLYHRALTRGDGKKGFDITNKVSHLVPTTIKHLQPIQVTGEIVAPSTIPNARNYAAGALNLKSEEEVRTRDISFVAYEITGLRSCYTYIANITFLREAGFKTVLDSQIAKGFPTDGKVFRENSYEEFNKAGFTAKHPRGAYALKLKPESVVTTLIDVIWQLGRTGVVSPVAILEPVKVGDALVSRATLHNMEYINALGLEIGCKVEIVRAGEIIPRVIGRIN